MFATESHSHEGIASLTHPIGGVMAYRRRRPCQAPVSLDEMAFDRGKKRTKPSFFVATSWIRLEEMIITANFRCILNNEVLVETKSCDRPGECEEGDWYWSLFI